MSRRIAIGLGLLIAFGLAWGFYKWDSPSKEKTLRARHEHGPRRTAKLKGPLDIRIELSGQAPEKAGDTYTLTGILKSEQALDKVTLSWRIGSNAELVSGAVEETLSIEANQEKTVSITLRSKGDKRQRVRLRAVANEGEASFAASAHYRTRSPNREFGFKDRFKARDGSPKRTTKEPSEGSTHPRKRFRQ